MPHVRLEVVFVEVVPVMAVISAEHVHVVFIDDAGVGVARARSLLRIQRLELLPGARLDAISMEVIDSVVAVVAAEDVDAAAVDDSCVSVSWARRLRAAI